MFDFVMFVRIIVICDFKKKIVFLFRGLCKLFDWLFTVNISGIGGVLEIFFIYISLLVAEIGGYRF